MTRQISKRGLFFTFEGGEGSGKSTQLKKLAAWLGARGHTVLTTREPGGTPLGESLRALLTSPQGKVTRRAELLMMEASRAQHVDDVILPALARSEIVLCDRYADSSLVYQGICAKLGLPKTQWLNQFATDGLKPEKVLIFDLPENLAMERVRARKGEVTKWDQMDKELHRKVRRGFLSIAAKNPKGYWVIDASGSEDAVFERVLEKMEPLLNKRKN